MRSTISPIRLSLTRSASVSARPQVGSAGQASAQRSAGTMSSTSRLSRIGWEIVSPSRIDS